jgi:NADH:ubiquinone oxidoreductase subunit K
MPTLSQLLSSKTVLFAIFVSVLGVLQGFVFLLPITPVMQMWVAIAIAVVVTVLRFKTSVALTDK